LTGILTGFPPVSGTVGDRASVAARWVISSGTVVRDIIA